MRCILSIKTISPGGTATDFTSRSLQVAEHEAYAGLFHQLMAGQGGGQFAPAEAIAEEIYQAAPDPQDQLRYPAGADAVATYTQRPAVAGREASRQGVATMFGLLKAVLNRPFSALIPPLILLLVQKLAEKSVVSANGTSGLALGTTHLATPEGACVFSSGAWRNDIPAPLQGSQYTHTSSIPAPGLP